MSRVALQAAVVGETIEEFVDGVVGALPDLLAAAVFLGLAYVGIRIVLGVARFGLERAYPADDQLVVDLFVAIIGLFLWFGAALALLNLLGMTGIAASLGTASGFVALGISYALSDVIADTVAGVYLLRDPDFNPGDRVTTAEVTGTVTAIGLRKSRLETEEGDTVVLANQAVDERWRLEASGGEATSAAGPTAGDGSGGETATGGDGRS